MTNFEALKKDLAAFFEKQLNDEVEEVNPVYDPDTKILNIEIWLVCGKGYGDNHYRERNYFVPCKEGLFDHSARFGKAIDDMFCEWAMDAQWCEGRLADETWADCNGWNITVKQELD